MANKQVVLKNKFIEATVRLPEGKQDSERFDAAGVVEQVVLNGKHKFFQVENQNPPAVGGTTYGVGLSSELMTTGIGRQAKPGEQFPKLGVGLLTQLDKGGDFDMITLYQGKPYDVEPFETKYEVFANRVEFVQEPKPCLGVAVRIRKTVEINANTLTISTNIENVGDVELEISELNHNFVSIDDMPIGKGYRLELPYDGTIGKISECAQHLDGKGTAYPELLHAEGQTIVYDEAVAGATYKKETYPQDIKDMPFYRWTLTNTNSDARIHETDYFKPSHIVLWGVGHVAVVENFVAFKVAPKQSHSFARTWTFEDAETGYLG